MLAYVPDVQRRTVLASVTAAVGALAGCGGTGPAEPGGADTTTDSDTETTTVTPRTTTVTPPGYLHERIECDQSGGMADGKTVFTLGPGRDEPRPNSGVIPYGSLSPGARGIVEFALANGRAETCSLGGREAIGEIMDAMDEAMGAGRERPERVYVRKRETYYEVGFRVGDQVFYEP